MLTIRDAQVAVLRRPIISQRLIDTFCGPGSPYSGQTTDDGVVLKDPYGHPTKIGFDEHGYIASATSPSGRKWAFQNDADGKLLGMTNPAGFRLGMRYDKAGALSAVSRNGAPLAAVVNDPDGHLSRIGLPDGSTVSMRYDRDGRPSVLTDRLGNMERYAHDDAGRLAAAVDGNGNATRFLYGEGEQPERTVYADGSNEIRSFGPDGGMRQWVDALGHSADIERNDAGQVANIRFSDGEQISFRYDDAGNLIEATSPHSVVRYRYDAQNRVISEEQSGFEIRYAYDTAGTLIGQRYPSGDAVRFRYDEDVRLSAIQDWNGRNYQIHYAPDDRGYALSYPNGLLATERCNENGLPAESVVSGGRDGPVRFSFVTEYGAEDRIGRFADSEFGTREYEYDREGQLLSVRSEHPDLVESFAYDAAGNRVLWEAAREGAGRASCNSLNQVTAQGGADYQYDAAGNLVAAHAGPVSWQYTFSARNLLVRARRSDGLVVDFAYDALGRRVLKRSGGTETRYVWAGEHLAAEIRNGETREYLYIPGTWTPLALRIGRQVYCYHTDVLGVPRRLTDQTGEVVWAADHSAYGMRRVAVQTVTNPLALPGHYVDAETGLHYNRHRYYSPQLGRYLSRDPLGFQAGLNLYTYAHNDPINDADPLGLWTWGGVLKGALSIAAGVAAGVAVVALCGTGVGAILLAGAVAGAVVGGLNTALDESTWKCGITAGLASVGLSALKGAAVGLVAAVPFVALPAAAGVGAFAAAGTLSGWIGYTADWALTPGAQWSWGSFLAAGAIGGVTAGLLKGYTQWKANRPIKLPVVESEPPPVKLPVVDNAPPAAPAPPTAAPPPQPPAPAPPPAAPAPPPAAPTPPPRPVVRPPRVPLPRTPKPSLTPQETVQADIDYRAYKARAAEQPPSGLTARQEAEWQLKRAEDVRDMRQAWDDKYWPSKPATPGSPATEGRHAEAIDQAERAIDNARARLSRLPAAPTSPTTAPASPSAAATPAPAAPTPPTTAPPSLPAGTAPAPATPAPPTTAPASPPTGPAPPSTGPTTP